LKDTFLSLEVFIWYIEYCTAFANVLLSYNNNYHKTLLKKQKLTVYQTQPPTPLPDHTQLFRSTLAQITIAHVITDHVSCIQYWHSAVAATGTCYQALWWPLPMVRNHWCKLMLYSRPAIVQLFLYSRFAGIYLN